MAEAVQLRLTGDLWRGAAREGGFRAVAALRLRPAALWRGSMARVTVPRPELTPRATPTVASLPGFSTDASAASAVGPAEPVANVANVAAQSGSAPEHAPSPIQGSPNLVVHRPQGVDLKTLPGFGAEFARRLVRHVGASPRREMRRLEGFGKDARLAAWLPAVRLRAGRSADQTLRFSPTEQEPNRWLQSGGADLRYQAQMTWGLGGLMFSGKEPSLERLRGQQIAEQRKQGQLALKLLFDWQLAAIRALDPELDPAERQKQLLTAHQQRAYLEVLTGGWFGRQIGNFPVDTVRELARTELPRQHHPKRSNGASAREPGRNCLQAPVSLSPALTQSSPPRPRGHRTARWAPASGP